MALSPLVVRTNYADTGCHYYRWSIQEGGADRQSELSPADQR